jgi:hypothetical protein
MRTSKERLAAVPCAIRRRRESCGCRANPRKGKPSATVNFIKRTALHHDNPRPSKLSYASCCTSRKLPPASNTNRAALVTKVRRPE